MQAMPMMTDAVSEKMVRRDMTTLLPGLGTVHQRNSPMSGFVDLEQCGP
jgi:hypothetical protein